jgi:tripartite-type tricarboxylate transporter receptor subunit TctC
LWSASPSGCRKVRFRLTEWKRIFVAMTGRAAFIADMRKEIRMCNRSLRSVLRLALTLLAVSLLVPDVLAQSYPSRSIRIIVPSAAGTPPDIVTRVIANELGQSEGWQIVIENKPGAVQTIGIAEALKQPADGYTLVVIAQSSAVAPAILPHVGFRLDTDLSPIIKLTSASHVLVVHPAVPANSLPELVSLLKSQPDKLTFSSGGFGTPAHLAGELFKLETGVTVAHVPYRALPQAIADLLNGTNQYQFITPLPVLDLIATGKLRAIAATAPARLPSLKDVPTVGEQGFPNLVIQDWVGLVVKNGTPSEIVVQLNGAVNKAIAKAAVRDAFAKMAAEPGGGSAEEFGAFVKSQTAYWAKVVRQSGIKMPNQ